MYHLRQTLLSLFFQHRHTPANQGRVPEIEDQASVSTSEPHQQLGPPLKLSRPPPSDSLRHLLLTTGQVAAEAHNQRVKYDPLGTNVQNMPLHRIPQDTWDIVESYLDPFVRREMEATSVQANRAVTRDLIRVNQHGAWYQKDVFDPATEDLAIHELTSLTAEAMTGLARKWRILVDERAMRVQSTTPNMEAQDVNGQYDAIDKVACAVFRVLCTIPCPGKIKGNLLCSSCLRRRTHLAEDKSIGPFQHARMSSHRQLLRSNTPGLV